VDHGQARPHSASAKSHPIRHIDFAGYGLGGYMEIAHAEESRGEEQPLHSDDDNLFRFGFSQQGLGTVARLQIKHFALARQLLEVIKIQRPVHRVQAKHPQVALAAVEDLNLEEAEGNVEVSHRTQRTES